MQRNSSLLLALLALLLPLGVFTNATDFDLIITGGRIVDGTGNPWFEADIAIKDGRIAAIGKIEPLRAAQASSAKGRCIAPGFIYVHAHRERGIERLPKAENFLRMGVTSVVTGNCGGSASNLGEWFAGLEKAGVSINIASLIGHNTVRRDGMN